MEEESKDSTLSVLGGPSLTHMFGAGSNERGKLKHTSGDPTNRCQRQTYQPTTKSTHADRIVVVNVRKINVLMELDGGSETRIVKSMIAVS
jgi:hypothetical protein